MARGGRRAGAGRKPGSKKRAVVLGMDGVRRSACSAVTSPPLVPPADPNGLAEPPASVTNEDEQKVWRELAPHALVERTLTPSRVPGFARLCKQWVYCQALDARIQVLGVATREADPLLRRLEKWEQALSASLGNFSLRSFGKPAASEKPKSAAANPWAAVVGK